jgi:hypothetical protein
MTFLFLSLSLSSSFLQVESNNLEHALFAENQEK